MPCFPGTSLPVTLAHRRPRRALVFGPQRRTLIRRIGVSSVDAQSAFRAGSLLAAWTPRSTTSDSRRSNRGAGPCRHTCGVNPDGALTTMTTLAEPALITTTAATILEPATPATRHPRQHTTTVHAIAPARRSHPVDAQASTEQLLCQRDDLPAGHPQRGRLRARAIEQNLSLANRLARRYAGRGELIDDLAQVAALALIKAVDSYNLSRDVPFAAYAIPSILGALKHHFRDTAWAVRLPRPIQELAQHVPTATGQLSHQHSRRPTPTELADHLDVSVDQLRAAVEAWQVYRLTSLNAPPATGIAADRIDLIGDTDPHYAQVDDYLTLRPLVAALPARQQRILTMRFYDHMTQTQIAAEIGLSQMHVSRLLKRTLGQLRAAMPG